MNRALPFRKAVMPQGTVDAVGAIDADPGDFKLVPVTWRGYVPEPLMRISIDGVIKAYATLTAGRGATDTVSVPTAGLVPGIEYTVLFELVSNVRQVRPLASRSTTMVLGADPVDDPQIGAHVVTAASGTTVSVPLPATAILGQRALICVGASSSADPGAATASGWTAITSYYSTAGSATFAPRITILEKILTAGDVAAGAVTVTHNTVSSPVDAVSLVLPGATSGVAQVSSGSSEFNTLITAPSITPTVDSVVITVFAAREGLLSWLSYPSGTLAFTDATSGGDNHILVAAQFRDGGASYAPGSASFTSNGTGGILTTISVAIPSAPAPDPEDPVEDADLLASDESGLTIGALTKTQFNTAFLPFTGASLRFQDSTIPNISAVVDGGVPSGTAIRMGSMAADTVGTTQPLRHTEFYFNGGTASTLVEAYTSAWLYFETGFDWRLGGKLPIGLAGGTIPQGGANSKNGNGFGLRLMFRGPAYGPPHPCFEAYTYSMESPTFGSEYRFEEGMGTSKASTANNPIQITTGQWYHVGLGVNLGTGSTGANRGWVKMYLDGVLVRTVPNVAFRASATQHYVSTAYMYYFHGGNTAAWTPTVNSYIRVGGYRWATTAAKAGLEPA